MTQRRHARLSTVAQICMAGGLLLSIVLALHLYQAEGERIHQEFQHGIDAHAVSINRQISEDIAILHSLKALFDSSKSVARAEFHTFASFLLAHYPAMQTVGWIPRITADERETIELLAQSEGVSAFQIRERKEPGVMIRAALRDEYYPICFMEPLEGNEAVFGFDLASNSTRREALYAARDTGLARATRRIKLVPETSEQWAVLIFVPIYTGTPTHQEERRKLIQGVVSGMFRIEDLLKAAGAHLSHDGMIDMCLMDELANGETEILHHMGCGTPDLATRFRYARRLTPAGGRQWTLVATPTTAYVAAKRSHVPLFSLLAGLLLTAWLSSNLARLAREKQRVEEQVERRTEELEVQRRALAASNQNLRREVQERRELQKRIADVTDHEQRRLGQELHDSLGQQIAVTTLLAQRLQQRLTAADAPEARYVARLTESAQLAQAQVRALSKGLLPMEIDREGLSAALEQLVTSAHGISDMDLSFEGDEAAVVEKRGVATHLYRIAQEALRNALEHSKASRVLVSLRRDEGRLTLRVEDDGRGLTPRTGPSSGAGLASMHYRADQIGASLTIESPLGRGTVVICCLPVADEPNDTRRPTA